MKKIIVLLLGVWVFTNMGFSLSKPPKKITVSFQVEGNCGMCKERIEESLDKKGIYKAMYSIETDQVTISYDPRKIGEIQLHNIVAMAGHDTEKVKASNTVYENLPDCCKYRNNKDEWELRKHQ